MTFVRTISFRDQKPGTSGLRRKVSEFQTPHFLQNFVQSIFDCLHNKYGQTLVLGGDGRFFNETALQVIIKMCQANGFGKLIVGQNGLLSTPAASHLIRLYKAYGGIILSASHNAGGQDGDFGIKYNVSNGGPAPEIFNRLVYQRTKTIQYYQISDFEDIDLSNIGEINTGTMRICIIDPVYDYTLLMQSLIDFDLVRKIIKDGFTFSFDAMHAVTGPYAKEIFINLLGVDESFILNSNPSPNFGGGHPDPNRVYSKILYDSAITSDGPDLFTASDGDGDRNVIVGKDCFVTASDSLAVLAANAHLVPGYRSGINAVARSMATSRAVDQVMSFQGRRVFETPTGWKFFVNLLEAGEISLCGEESAGTGSKHLREKDGIWAILMWLNILAVRKQSVKEVMQDHWRIFGRNYYTRHDFEEVDTESACRLMVSLKQRLSSLQKKETIISRINIADEFSYRDPIEQSVIHNEGIRLIFEDGSRIMFRLSGTRTVGETLRIYMERYVGPDGNHSSDILDVIFDLVTFSYDIAQIEYFTGRTSPSLIA
ncbi:alpha-D-glucose phosphate-specific phosphoglucomutase [Candidatus Endowatersipora endosymbiont of Watersipora subatra]|uniref:alpha-D-glucose phosphate-specific phosphoglucomutase n=1 Tax=Candidatus Endowatersipora endosymbiont of Watersipora subatra TaxID=3077946 RepID=UPI00312CAC99